MKASIVKDIRIVGVKLVYVLLLFSTDISVKAQDGYLDFVQYALSAVQRDSIDKAIYYFREAIAVDPHNEKNALVYSNIGKLLEQQGNTAEALKNYSKAIDEYPENIVFRRSRADLYLKSSIYDKAISDYKKIVDNLLVASANPNMAFDSQLATLYSLIGYAYCKTVKYDEAQQYIDKSLALNPTEYMALLGNCILQIQWNRQSEAKKQIEHLIAIYPDKAELYALRADTEKDSELFELAVADISKAIELEPNNSSYVLFRADMYFDQHQYRKALPDYLRAIELGIPRSAINEKLQKCR